MGCRSNGRHGQSFTIHGKASQSPEEMVGQGHAREPCARARQGVFSQRSPGAIARSLKRSAERSRARKSSPYRSAMSMLTFYINRGGKGLSASRRRTLESAKGELRRLFGKQKA